MHGVALTHVITLQLGCASPRLEISPCGALLATRGGPAGTLFRAAVSGAAAAAGALALAAADGGVPPAPAPPAPVRLPPLRRSDHGPLS